MSPLLLLLGCLQIADRVTIDATMQATGVGLRGAATLGLGGADALPWTTEILTDPGMELVAEVGPSVADPTPQGTLWFEAEAPGTYGFTVDLDGSPSTAPDAAGELGFVAIDGLALDTTGWAPEAELRRVEQLHLEAGVQLDALVFVDPEGRPVEGSAELEELDDEAQVFDGAPEVVDGRLGLDTRAASSGGASVRLLDGTAVALPELVLTALPDEVGAGWSLGAEVWEAEDQSLAFQLWLTAPDGGPLLTERSWGECVQEGGTVMDLTALDGIPTADPGCEVSACLDPAEAPHTLGVCVGEACATFDAPVRLSFREDPLNPECPWQEG